MIIDHAQANSTSKLNSPTGTQTDDKQSGWVRQATSTIIACPSTIDAFIKQHPYKSLGIACILGAGLGAGALLGSRILRATVIATASVLTMELMRTYLGRDATRNGKTKAKGNGASSDTADAS